MASSIQTLRPWVADSERARMRLEFMTAHGFRPSARPQVPRSLRYRDGLEGLSSASGSTFDHAELFIKDREAACYVTQPYGYSEADLEAICHELELRAFIYPAACSWYYPYRTDLIALVPIELADEFERVEDERLAKPRVTTAVEFLSYADTLTKDPQNPFRLLKGRDIESTRESRGLSVSMALRLPKKAR